MNKFKKLGLPLLTLAAVATMAGCNQMTFSGEDFISIEEVIAHAKTLTSESSESEEIEKTGTPNFDVPEEGFDMNAEVTITFYSTQGKQIEPITKEYIGYFEQMYPNIHVEHTQLGGYDDVRDQIKTEIPVGTYPNLAYCYPDHVALYNLSKKVVTLDNLIDSQASDGKGGIIGLTQAQKDDFIKGYYDEGRSFGDGLMYSLPYSKSTEILYYNKTVFQEQNLSVPTHWFSEGEDDTTSMEYVCKKLKEAYPSDIPLGYDSEANWMITMAEQCGADYTSATGEHFLFDNTTMKAIAKRFGQWYNNGWVTTEKLYGTYTSGLFCADKSKATADDPKTRSFMSIGSSAGANHQVPDKIDGVYPFDVGVSQIPQMCETNRKVISQGPSVCIFKKADKQEVIASWLLLKYLTTNVQYQASFGKKSGYVPVIKSVSQDPTYSAFMAQADQGNDYCAAAAARLCLEQEDAYYTSPAFNGSSMARDQIGAALAKILPACSGKTNENYNKFINEVFYKAIKECEQSI